MREIDPIWLALGVILICLTITQKIVDERHGRKSASISAKAKKILIIVAIAVAVFIGGWMALLSTLRLSMEEIQQYLEPQILKQWTYFEDEYDCKGESSFDVDYSDLSIQWEPFSLVQGHFNISGRIIGEMPVVVDTPVAYPYLEKDSYLFADVKALHIMQCAVAHDGTSFDEYDDFEVPHYAFFPSFRPEDVIFLDSHGNTYDIIYISDNHCYLSKNGETVFKRESKPGACPWCNGTGSVRYNYGSSDLEAILSGHDPYTYGTCGSCGGTGKAK